MKRCNGCGKRKPFEAYYNDPQNRDGKFGICKDCHYKRNVINKAKKRARKARMVNGHNEGYYERFKKYR